MCTRSMLALVFLCLIAGCKQSKKQITSSSDYEKYLNITSIDSMHSMQRIKADMDFWQQRLVKNPDDAVAKSSLAGLYSARFRTAGHINDIHLSDSLYHAANSLFKTNSSSIYRSLATNCITQHKFRQAQLYLDTATTMGDDRYLTLLMQFDVALELGNIYAAKKALSPIANKNDFDYLVRQSKLLDHKGDIDEAIKKMEEATVKATASKKEALIIWTKSNLGDMYGHANRYEDAYRCYLEVLELRPDYLYALKGIAWLAFSHDKNAMEAKRILSYLSNLHPVPDYDLLLADIAAYEKDHEAEKKLLDKFLNETSNKRYGDMYNKYIFYVMTDNTKDLKKALEIAETEVNNRPTGQSYDLLAWAYYLLGKKEEALKISKSFVENRNYEPDALYHLGKIYADAGDIQKAKHFMREAENSGFELGPVLAEKIQRELHEIENR